MKKRTLVVFLSVLFSVVANAETKFIASVEHVKFRDPVQTRKCEEAIRMAGATNRSSIPAECAPTPPKSVVEKYKKK